MILSIKVKFNLFFFIKKIIVPYRTGSIIDSLYIEPVRYGTILRTGTVQFGYRTVLVCKIVPYRLSTYPR